MPAGSPDSQIPIGPARFPKALNSGFVYCTTLVLLQFWARLLSGPLCHNTACIFFEPDSLDLQAPQNIAKNNKNQKQTTFWGEVSYDHLTSQGQVQLAFCTRSSLVSGMRCGVSRGQGLWEAVVGPVGRVCPHVPGWGRGLVS